MSETGSVTASSLAITEKKPRKTGGCVGIFFQLFDWNRRFAKKKLFSKRLLPPDRTKEASKKFGADERLPKLRLIADENSGGFPNLNKNGVSNVNNNRLGKNGGGVQTPSLVARLMGLESMPSVQNKLQNHDFSDEFCGGRREKVVGNGDEIEKETTRQEFRPQKLQKTGMVERRSVTRFGAEALQLKNVLSRSRKHHHHHYPKLASPVKSTSHHASRRNSSRLIGAATRILEPGLQSRGKSKYAITYAHSVRRPPTGNEPRLESMNGGEHVDLSSGQASCKNCGNLLDIAESTSKRDNNHTSSAKSVQMSLNGKSRFVSSSFDQEQEFVPWHLTNQPSQPQKFASPSNLKENTRKTVDVSLGGDGVSSQSKSNCLPFNKVASATDAVTDTKDFVALNRSLSGRTRSRVPPKVEDTKFDKRNKFENSGQKRQLTHVRKQGESSGIVCCTNRPRMVTNAAFPGKQMRPNACSMDLGQSSKVCSVNKNSDGMAFRFSSVTKNRYEVPAKVERRRNQNAASPCKTTSRKNSTSNQSDEKILQKTFPLSGSSLGAALEEKLKELANQIGYESGINGIPPKSRTSASIFQDLICALNRERPLARSDKEFSPQRNHLSQYCNHRYDHHTSFCSKTRSEKAGSLVGHKNIDHLSPGSVLEASFSNDSCCSSSLEDSTGRIQHADSTSYSYDDSQIQESEKDPFYSGVSLIKDNIYSKFVADLLTSISEVLCHVGVLNTRIKRNTFAYAKEVIFNAELVFGTQTPRNPNKLNSFFVCLLLLEPDTLAEVMQTRFGKFLGSNTRYQLKRFAFDCLIEYLESKYSQYSKCGFKAWMNHPAFAGSDILLREVVEEVRKWTGFVGETTDELVERDMSHSLGKWTDFEIEAYEAGAKIEGDIVEMLVDEIVVDLTTNDCIVC